jgi:hypothetical protein
MTTAQPQITAPIAAAAEPALDPAAVLTAAGGHFVHDSFTSFLSPLLPLIIQKLGLSLTMAGDKTKAIPAAPGIAFQKGGKKERGGVRFLALPCTMCSL